MLITKRLSPFVMAQFTKCKCSTNSTYRQICNIFIFISQNYIFFQYQPLNTYTANTLTAATDRRYKKGIILYLERDMTPIALTMTE